MTHRSVEGDLRDHLSRPAAVVLPSGELEVLPRHALVLVTGVAQEKCGMEGGDQHGGPIWVHTTAKLANRLAGTEQALARDAAECEHHLALEHRELCRQERRARRELLGFGISIAGRSAVVTDDARRDVGFVLFHTNVVKAEVRSSPP